MPFFNMSANPHKIRTFWIITNFCRVLTSKENSDIFVNRRNKFVTNRFKKTDLR